MSELKCVWENDSVWGSLNTDRWVNINVVWNGVVVHGGSVMDMWCLYTEHTSAHADRGLNTELSPSTQIPIWCIISLPF